MQPVRLDESACSIPEMTTASDLIGTNPSVGSELKMEGYTPIGFEHMNMRNFAMLSLGNSFIIRTLIYPTTLIKTRLQVEKSGELCRLRDSFLGLFSSTPPPPPPLMICCVIQFMKANLFKITFDVLNINKRCHHQQINTFLRHFFMQTAV